MSFWQEVEAGVTTGFETAYLERQSLIRYATDREYFSRPASRIRPLMLCAGYAAITGDESSAAETVDCILNPRVLNIAIHLENLQAAILAVDDYLDNTEERRGARSLHSLYLEQRPQLRTYHYDLIFELSNHLNLAIIELTEALLQAYHPDTRVSRDFIRERAQITYQGMFIGTHSLPPLRWTAQTIDLLEEWWRRLGTQGGCYELLSLYFDTLRRTLYSAQHEPKWVNCQQVPTPTELTWYQQMKTSQYTIVFPLLAGAYLAGELPGSQSLYRLTSIGNDLGTAYQTLNDLRPEGLAQDLTQRVVTMPTATHFHYLNTDEAKAEWLNLMTQCDQPEMTGAAIEQMNEAGTFDICHRLIVDCVGRVLRDGVPALQSIDRYPGLLEQMVRQRYMK